MHGAAASLIWSSLHALPCRRLAEGPCHLLPTPETGAVVFVCQPSGTGGKQLGVSTISGREVRAVNSKIKEAAMLCTSDANSGNPYLRVIFKIKEVSLKRFSSLIPL